MFSLPASVRSTLTSPPAVLSQSTFAPSAFSAGNFSVAAESSWTLLLLNFFGSNMSMMEKEILCVDGIFIPQSFGSSILCGEKGVRGSGGINVRNYALGEELLIVWPTSCLGSFIRSDERRRSLRVWPRRLLRLPSVSVAAWMRWPERGL